MSSHLSILLHSHLAFLFLPWSPLFVPSSLFSQSSPLELSTLWLSPGLAVSVVAAAGGFGPLHSVQFSSLTKRPEPCWAAQGWLCLLRYSCPMTQHAQVLVWMMMEFIQKLFFVVCRPRWQRLCSAVQPGVWLLSSNVFLQQQHCGLSREGPYCHPRPPAWGHDWDVSTI